MALVKCPECGRENVSDSAESCPNCGYAIKQYFDDIKEQERILQRKREKQKEWEELEEIKKETAGDRQKEAIKELMNKISKDKQGIICSFVGLLIIVPLFVFLLHISEENNFGGIIVFEALLIFFCLALLISYISDKRKNTEKLKIAKQDFDEYEKRIVECKIGEIIDFECPECGYNQSYRSVTPYSEVGICARCGEMTFYNSNNENNNENDTPVLKSLKCPVCGSLNIKRISTLNRTISVATVGLASSKIGKQ